MRDPGKLVVAIPTGYGTNGVRKEALAVLLNLISEMSVDGIVTKKWGSYYLPVPDPEASWTHTYKKWGMIVTAEVNDLEHCKLIVQDFGYDLGDHPQHDAINTFRPHFTIRNPYAINSIKEP